MPVNKLVHALKVHIWATEMHDIFMTIKTCSHDLKQALKQNLGGKKGHPCIKRTKPNVVWHIGVGYTKAIYVVTFSDWWFMGDCTSAP